MTAICEGRDINGKQVQTIGKITSELFFGDQLGEVGIRGRQYANIDALSASTAQALKFLLLQNSQKLGLQFERYIADLIQKQRSLVRQLESSNPLGYGACKRAFLMTKQLAFEKAKRNGCAIHFYKRMTLARAQIVNCAGDHFFASTRLALYEDRRIRRRNDSNALKHSFQRLTISNDLFEIVLKPDFVFQVERLLRQPIPSLRYLLIVQSILDADGDLRRYLCKEPDVSLAEGVLLPSAKSQKAKDAIPADKWHETAGLKALGDSRFILQTQLKYVGGIDYPSLASAEDITTKRPLHRTVILSNESFALRKIEREGLHPVPVQVRQEDAHQIALHDAADACRDGPQEIAKLQI